MSELDFLDIPELERILDMLLVRQQLIMLHNELSAAKLQGDTTKQIIEALGKRIKAQAGLILDAMRAFDKKAE